MHCKENPIYVFVFWELHSISPNFHIHVSVSDLYIPRIGPHISLQQNRQTDPGYGTAPAYLTRRKDGVFYPSAKTFNNAYNRNEQPTVQNQRDSLPNLESHNLDKQQSLQIWKKETTLIAITVVKLKP